VVAVASDAVGGLYVSVGVDAKKAIVESEILLRRLQAISRQINTMGASASFNGLTAKLTAANTQLAKSNAAVAAGPQQQVRQAQITQQQMTKMHAQALRMDAQRTNSAQISQRQMTKLHAQALRMDAARARSAEVSSRRVAKAAEDAARRQNRANRLLASSRSGALKRGGADFATAGAAFFSGNSAYGVANAAQGVVKLTGAFTGMGAAAAGAAVGVGAVGIAATAVGAIMVAVGAKITTFGVQQAANFEMLQIQLTGLLGSAEAGKQEMDFLLNLGKDSIVPTQSLIQADRLMLAFGVTVNRTRRDLVQFMSDFGTATGANEQQVYFLSLALGQVASFGKANSVDMRQLANAGINTMAVYKIIGDEIGMSAKKVAQGVSEGIITSERLFAALDKYGEQFEETAEMARNSTQGLWSNIKDVIVTEMGLAFTSINGMVSRFLKYVMQAVEAINFQNIADSVEISVRTIAKSFGQLNVDIERTADFFSVTLPNAIMTTAFVFARAWQVIYTGAKALGAALGLVIGSVLHVIDLVLSGISAVVTVQDKLGILDDETAEKIRGTVDGWADTVRAEAELAVKAASDAFDDIEEMWNKDLTLDLFVSVQRSPVTIYPTGSREANDAAAFYGNMPDPLAGLDPIKPPKRPSPPGGSGANPALAAIKKVIDAWKELVAQSIKGRDALREALIVPFAAKVTEGGGTLISEAFKAFTSGDMGTIVGQYKTLRQALVDYYALAESRGGKGAKAMAAARKADIAFLKAQTGELVRLAAEAQAAQDAFEKAQEAFDDASEEIARNRDAMERQRGEQAKRIARQYDDYYTASSATVGALVRGAISQAQDALDSATAAYESAKERLDELQAARDEYLQSLKEMAYSFVNDLSKAQEEITRFTRLDAVGSFSSVTEQVADTESFTQGLKDRLKALQEFAANVARLTASGLESGLLQQIMAAGPEESGALAKALAGSSAAQIAEINRVQAELAATTAGMQGAAGAAWFDGGIAAQQGVVTPLKAAMDAAQSNLDRLTAEKDLALGVLEAWYTEQNEMYDAQQAVQDAQLEAAKETLRLALEANQAEAERIAATIDARLNGLPTTAYSAGMNTIQGLIDGLKDEEKLEELRKAAAAMARQVARAVNNTLEIRSPSRVGVEAGLRFGQGLAGGLGLSEPMVGAAAAHLAGSVSTLGGDGAALGGDTVVKVFIGDRELTDIVDVQIDRRDAREGASVLAGRRIL
jgi:hypothetical protein